GDRAGLAPEALDVLAVVGVLLVQDLESDLPVQQAVVRAKDARHAAGADELLELVPAGEDLANHRPAGYPRRSGAKRRFERLLPGLERLVELAVGDDERDEHADRAAVDPGLQEQQAALQRLLDHLRGGV